MDILYGDKLNCSTFNPLFPFIFLFWTAIRFLLISGYDLVNLGVY